MKNGDRPRIELGEPPGKLGRSAKRGSNGFLWLIVLLQLVVVVILLAGSRPLTMHPQVAATPADIDTLRTVAIDLEDRGLSIMAAAAWEEYLRALPDRSEYAVIHYRIGNEYLEARAYDRAAAHFLRAERAPGCDDELRRKIGPKMVECLRKVGLYGEVSRELARRTSTQGRAEAETGAPVLATFAGEAFTQTDLDRLVRFRVDRLLAMQGLAGDPNARNALLQQMTAPEVRQQLFSEILRTELLSRRSRELRLQEDETYLNALALVEQELLATMLLERELGAIKATDVDLQAYFRAHSSDYADPEKTDETPSFEDVRDRVRTDYLAQKRREVGEDLLQELMARFDVRIVQPPSASGGVAPSTPPAENGESGTTEATGTTDADEEDEKP